MALAPTHDRPDRIPLPSLEILVAVDTHGSISAAARALAVSQPTASTSLKRLERRLGLALLSRTTRGAQLTGVGATVATWAREVLSASDTFENSLAALQQTPASRVRLAASMTIAEYLAPRWLSHPGSAGTDVELLVRNSQGVMDLVLAGDADLGFVECPRLRSGLRSRTLVEDTLSVVVRPEHPWARRRSKRASVAEFTSGPLVVREAGSGTRETLENALTAVGLELPAHLPHYGSTASLKMAVLLSDTVTAVSHLAVEEDLARGALIEIDVPDLDLTRKLRMVWRAAEPMPASVRAIAGFVLEH